MDCARIFLDEGAEQLFNMKNKHLNKEKLANVLNEVKNIKPTSGPDVDVFIGICGKNSKTPVSYLTYKEPNSLIRKGFIYIENKKHSLENILNAFKKLANQVDSTRIMEEEAKATRTPIKHHYYKDYL